MKTKQCRCCKGSGEELDREAVGAEMKRLRKKNNLEQAEVAKRMGFSRPYLCDLEKGLRNWTEAKIEAYQKACAS